MEVPQTMPLVGQEANNAGGYSYRITPMEQLRRFLVLGTEGGCYYVNEVALTIANAQCVYALITENDGQQGVSVVEMVVDYSVNNRAPKVNPGLFVLAMCATFGNNETKQRVHFVFNSVCRIPTHFFTFLEYYKALHLTTTGWGRAMRRCVANWYHQQSSKSITQLAYKLTKYKQRNGWSHRDVLRLCHAKPANNAALQLLLSYVVNKNTMKTTMEEMCMEMNKLTMQSSGEDLNETANMLKLIQFLHAIETLKALPQAITASQVEEHVSLIEEHDLCREHLPTSFLSSDAIWRVLLKSMPMTAMLRNLGKLGSLGLLGEQSPETALVVNALNDRSRLVSARIHPIAILIALVTYRKGSGFKGSLSWPVNSAISQALDNAFYLAFDSVQPTNKRFLLALDVSGSMTVPCSPVQLLSCMEASAALAMATARTEKNHTFVAFSHHLVKVPIDNSMSIDAVIKEMKKIPMGGTDCALPMLYATERKLSVDVFMVYTDSETYYGNIHPTVALQKYRLAMNIPHAKLIVVGMTACSFTIADPNDRGMLDVVGFDTSVPDVIQSFVNDGVDEQCE